METPKKRAESLSNRLKEYEAALSNNPKSRQSDLVRLKKSEKAGSSSQYLRKILKDILPRALHDVCQVRPVDPIEYLAKWLYKAADNDLYFQEKALFEKQKQEIEVKMKAEDIKRQNALERYKRHIAELKVRIQKEESKRVSLMEEPKRRKQSYSIPGPSKDDFRRRSLFDSYNDQSGIRSQSQQSEPVTSKTSAEDLLTPPKQRKSIRQPSFRIGSSPPSETYSPVSIRKDSSTSRTLLGDAFERSPSTFTSSSRTLSRMVSLSQEGQEDVLGSHPQEIDIKAKLEVQKGRKQSERPSLKENKGVLEPPEDLKLRKKSKKYESLIDVPPSYVSLGDRDKISHDELQDLGSTSQMEKADSTHKIKPSMERHDKRRSTQIASKDEQIKYSAEYKQRFSGIGREVTEREVDDGKLSDDMTSLFSDQQMTEFEEGSQEQLALEEDGISHRRRTQPELISADDRKSIRRKTTIVISPEEEQASQRKRTEPELISADDRKSIRRKTIVISPEEKQASQRKRTEPELISADDRKLIRRKTTFVISPEEEQASQRKRTEPELISSEGVEPIRRKRTEPELISSEGVEPIRRKRTEPELKSLEGEESLGRKTTQSELLSTTDEEASSSNLSSQTSDKKTISIIDEPNLSFKVKKKRAGEGKTAGKSQKVGREIDSEADISDENVADDGQQDEEEISGKIKKTKKAKGKQKSKSRGSFDADTEEKPIDEGKDLEAEGKPSTVVFKLKQKKKKLAKKYSGKLTDDEDTEYEDESRRLLRRGSSSSSRRRRSTLKQREDEDEEDEQQGTRFKKRDSIKSTTSMVDEDGKPVPRKRMKKRRRSIPADVSDDASPLGIDAESIPKLSDTTADSAVESSDRKKRVRRRVKKHDAKSTDDELEKGSDVDPDKLSPLLSQPPSTESSMEDLLKGTNAPKLSKKGKPATSGIKPVSKKPFAESLKGAASKAVKSLTQFKRRASVEPNETMGSDYSGATDQSTDSQLGMSTSTLPMVEETETFPFTPVECEWFLVGSQTLVCRHPVLGDIRSRPAIVTQSFTGWPDRISYNWRGFYDHEVYTVVDPYTSDVKMKLKR